MSQFISGTFMALADCCLQMCGSEAGAVGHPWYIASGKGVVSGNGEVWCSL
jgi:hypothetical protein